jgi:hypothetical protein
MLPTVEEKWVKHYKTLVNRKDCEQSEKFSPCRKRVMPPPSQWSGEGKITEERKGLQEESNGYKGGSLEGT